MIQCINLCNLWTSANGLTGWLRLQRYMIRKLVVRKSEEKVCRETIPNRQNLMICVPCECSSKSDPSRESFCNQVWDSYFYAGTHTSLTTPINASWAHELIAVTAAEMEVIHVLSIVDFLSKRVLWPFCWCPNFSKELQQRPMCRPLKMMLFQRWKHPATESYLHWDTAMWKGHLF